MNVAAVSTPHGQYKLGAILPDLAFDYGRLRVLKFGDRQKVALRLGAYLDAAAAAALPDSTNWRAKAGASIEHVYLNDRYGDCVIAGKYHKQGVWTANDSGTAELASDNEVLNSYHTICGPGDNGCIISDVLDYWQRNGLKFNGQTRKIDAYVSCDHTNKDLVRAGILIFGGGGSIGIDLPSAWANSPDGGTWDVTNTRSVGGHDVCVLDYDPNGVWIATWGGTRLITWAAFTSRKWIGELYFALGPGWYGSDKLAPNGIDAAKLADDLAKLDSGVIPDIAPPTFDFADFL